MPENLDRVLDILKPLLAKNEGVVILGDEPNRKSCLTYQLLFPPMFPQIDMFGLRVAVRYGGITFLYDDGADRIVTSCLRSYIYSLGNKTPPVLIDNLNSIKFGGDLGPIGQANILLAERTFVISKGLLDFTFQIDDEGLFLEISPEIIDVKEGQRDPILLNLALAAFHGEVVDEPFLDRCLEMDWSLAGELERVLLANQSKDEGARDGRVKSSA